MSRYFDMWNWCSHVGFIIYFSKIRIQTLNSEVLSNLTSLLVVGGYLADNISEFTYVAQTFTNLHVPKAIDKFTEMRQVFTEVKWAWQQKSNWSRLLYGTRFTKKRIHWENLMVMLGKIVKNRWSRPLTPNWCQLIIFYLAIYLFFRNERIWN